MLFNTLIETCTESYLLCGLCIKFGSRQKKQDGLLPAVM